MVAVFHAPKLLPPKTLWKSLFMVRRYIAKRILEVLIKTGARMAKARNLHFVCL